MKDVALLLIGNLSSIICVIGAVWLCYKGKKEWPWFLGFAIMLQVTIHIS